MSNLSIPIPTEKKCVTYENNLLILKIEAAFPNQTHADLLRGISVALRESLYVESLTAEERDGLAALGQLGFQLVPTLV